MLPAKWELLPHSSPSAAGWHSPKKISAHVFFNLTILLINVKLKAHPLAGKWVVSQWQMVS